MGRRGLGSGLVAPLGSGNNSAKQARNPRGPERVALEQSRRPGVSMPVRCSSTMWQARWSCRRTRRLAARSMRSSVAGLRSGGVVARVNRPERAHAHLADHAAREPTARSMSSAAPAVMVPRMTCLGGATAEEHGHRSSRYSRRYMSRSRSGTRVRDAERAAARQDRNLVDRDRRAGSETDRDVPGLVHRGGVALVARP